MLKKKDSFYDSMAWFEGLDELEKLCVDDALFKIDRLSANLFPSFSEGLDELCQRTQSLENAMTKIYKSKRKAKKFACKFSELVINLYSYKRFDPADLLPYCPENELMGYRTYAYESTDASKIMQNDLFVLDAKRIMPHSKNTLFPEKKLYIFPFWDEPRKSPSYIVTGEIKNLFKKVRFYCFSSKDNIVTSYNASGLSRESVDFETEMGIFVSKVMASSPEKDLSIFLKRDDPRAKNFIESRFSLYDQTDEDFYETCPVPTNLKTK